MINPEDVEEIYEDERGFFVFSKLAKTNEKYQFEERWNMKPKKVEEMNAGELTLHSLRGFAVMFCIVFLLPLLLYFLGWETPFSRVLGYVADGNWGNVMADILAGFFIIFERSFDVGDFVAIGSTYGIVTEIGLRTTKVRWYADISVINNSEIKTVINQSGNVLQGLSSLRRIRGSIALRRTDLIYGLRCTR